VGPLAELGLPKLRLERLWVFLVDVLVAFSGSLTSDTGVVHPDDQMCSPLLGCGKEELTRC